MSPWTIYSVFYITFAKYFYEVMTPILIISTLQCIGQLNKRTKYRKFNWFYIKSHLKGNEMFTIILAFVNWRSPNPDA